MISMGLAEPSSASLSMQHICNNQNHKPCILGLFHLSKRLVLVLKEIIRQQKRIPQIQGFPWICGIFLLDRKLRRQIIFEQITGQGV